MILVEQLAYRQSSFALEGITFAVPQGTYAALTGRTGSGKTTLLELLAGLRNPLSGRILLRGRDVTRFPPAERNIGYVPQDGALFRAMTVRENLGFALSVRRKPQEEIDRRVNELAEWLGVTALLDRSPQGLSGGETQRVALGRSLAFHPDILLLDEPLNAVDEDARGELLERLELLKQTRTVTVIHVTHSRSEVKRLAEVVLELAAGKVTCLI
jgi:molybdate/tungstate transport system ATP-binding protein